jgi:hypothetical protein
MVDKCTDDKSQLTRDVETLSVRLAESNYMINHLHKENVSVLLFYRIVKFLTAYYMTTLILHDDSFSVVTS